MQDDPLLFDYNVEERVNDFVAAAIAQVHLFIVHFSLWGFFVLSLLSLQLYTQQGSADTTNFTLFRLY